MDDNSALTRGEEIEQYIFLIRGHRVMLDSHLAALYGVQTKQLNRTVKRNLARFPLDFMLQLKEEEFENLRRQIGTSSSDSEAKPTVAAFDLRFQFGISSLQHGGRRTLPYVFTEQGVAMLSSVLRSPRAIQVNVAIMRAFVRLRETLSAHKELAHKLAELERKIESHDESIRTLFEAIRQLMKPPERPRKQIVIV